LSDPDDLLLTPNRPPEPPAGPTAKKIKKKFDTPIAHELF